MSDEFYGFDDPDFDIDDSRDSDIWDGDSLVNEQDRDRPIDQIYCTGCGRPMMIWADKELKSAECARCRSGLTPEWEY